MTFASQGAGERGRARSAAERRGPGRLMATSSPGAAARPRLPARGGAGRRGGTMRLSGQRCPVPAAGKGPRLPRERGRKFCGGSVTAGPEPGPGAPSPAASTKAGSCPGPAAPAAPAPARGCRGARPHAAPGADTPACKSPINSSNWGKIAFLFLYKATLYKVHRIRTSVRFLCEIPVSWKCLLQTGYSLLSLAGVISKNPRS